MKIPRSSQKLRTDMKRMYKQRTTKKHTPFFKIVFDCSNTRSAHLALKTMKIIALLAFIASASACLTQWDVHESGCYCDGCQPATDGNYYPCAGTDGMCYRKKPCVCCPRFTCRICLLFCALPCYGCALMSRRCACSLFAYRVQHTAKSTARGRSTAPPPQTSLRSHPLSWRRPCGRGEQYSHCAPLFQFDDKFSLLLFAIVVGTSWHATSTRTSSSRASRTSRRRLSSPRKRRKRSARSEENNVFHPDTPTQRRICSSEAWTPTISSSKICSHIRHPSLRLYGSRAGNERSVCSPLALL